MTETTTICRDIYVRYTDGGARTETRVVCHRVWNAERFMAARKAECEKLNAERRDKHKAGDPLPYMGDVQQITEEQYRRERGNWRSA